MLLTSTQHGLSYSSPRPNTANKCRRGPGNPRLPAELRRTPTFSPPRDREVKPGHQSREGVQAGGAGSAATLPQWPGPLSASRPAAKKPPRGGPQARPQALPGSGEALWKNFPQLRGFRKLPWSWDRRSSRDWSNAMLNTVHGEPIRDVGSPSGM